jgi:hypothetical protein
MNSQIEGALQPGTAEDPKNEILNIRNTNIIPTENQVNTNAFGFTVQKVAKKTKLDFALYLASIGYRVFPCVPNMKSPSITGWQTKATRDPEQIKKWWSGRCQVITSRGNTRILSADCNIGISPGLDYIILDVDVKNDQPGLESLQKLINEGLPHPGFAVRTPSGGIHLYYENTDKRPIKSVTHWRPGIDIRAYGGLSVGPGSTIDGIPYKIYEFEEVTHATSC